MSVRLDHGDVDMQEAHEETYAANRLFLESLLGDLTPPAGKGIDPRLAAIALSSLLDGLWLEYCLSPKTVSPEEAVRLCMICLEGLVGAADAPG